MRYKTFNLDKFQIDAIKAIDNNHSVVVSAATGTGKTLIADYVVNEAIKKNLRVIYTSPIKALSNQKFREFRDDYGEKVGLLTGDVSINPSAPILIMTTEIYRNMLLEKEPLDDLSYVVFDEIHFINDIERGTIWEESLIFSPSNVRFLCLSATIPNYKQFADWISKIKGHPVETVNYMKRAVPLKHEFYDFNLGLCNLKELREDRILSYHDVVGLQRRGRGRNKNRYNKGDSRKKRVQYPLVNYVEVLKILKREDAIPCIFFTFSRKDAFEKSREMGRKFDYTTSDEKKEILEFLRKEIPENIKDMESVKQMRNFLPKGFAVHHAGILPKMKEIVEKLFAQGLIKVLFATETFAVGINMPARAVVLNSIKKYDGFSVRYLSTKEYFQMAGRAGRRGIDDFGRVIVIINRNDLRQKGDYDELERITSKDVESIISRFSVSYNTTLNLIKNNTKEERNVILKSNFGNFAKKGLQNRIDQSYINYIYTLKKMKYVVQVEDEVDGRKVKDYKITWKGAFACHIFSHELILTELYYSKILNELSDSELILYIASLEYEPRMSDSFEDKGVSIGNLYSKLENNKYIYKRIKKRNLKKMYKFINHWVNGGDFAGIFDYCNLAEGDVIRLFRRIIDNLKQIKSALVYEKDEETIRRMNECINKIDRDIIKVTF